MGEGEKNVLPTKFRNQRKAKNRRNRNALPLREANVLIISLYALKRQKTRRTCGAASLRHVGPPGRQIVVDKECGWR